MQGPTAARMRSRRAPRPSMAASVASSTPPNAPRQPACAAATTPACGVGKQHGRAVGRQHAEREAARAVTMASAAAAPPAAQALVDDDGGGAVHLVAR